MGTQEYIPESAELTDETRRIVLSSVPSGENCKEETNTILGENKQTQLLGENKLRKQRNSILGKKQTQRTNKLNNFRQFSFLRQYYDVMAHLNESVPFS